VHDGGSGGLGGARTEMGKQISLQQLFGQQRAQDDGWSVKVHSPERRMAGLAPSLVHEAGAGVGVRGQGQGQGQHAQGRDILGDLFRKAVVSQGQGEEEGRG